MSLSDAWLKSNHGKIRGKKEELADRDGLSVRVSEKGKITFQMRFRHAGKGARLDIGSYPSMGLKQARTECSRLRAELEQGHDPRIIKKLERSTIQNAHSLSSLFVSWYESIGKSSRKNPEEILRSFEIHAFTTLGDLPAESITLHHWLALLEPLAKVRPAIAERILGNARQMYHWARRRQIVDINPLSEITRRDLGIVRNIGERSLNDDELHNVLDGIENSRLSQKNRLFLKLCIFYGCRNGEIRKAEKSHFDFAKMTWTVPPENHKLGKKTGRPIIRPIISEIVPMLEELFLLSKESRFLFQKLRSSIDAPMGERSTLSFPTNIMQWLNKKRNVEMQHWSMHDLRKTARTNWSQLTQPHVAEIMLGHKLPGVWQVYDHHQYLDEQAEAYRAWHKKLEFAGIPNVVNISQEY